eukprot:gene4518-5534_t
MSSKFFVVSRLPAPALWRHILFQFCIRHNADSLKCINYTTVFTDADSKIFEKNFMPQLAPRLAGIAKVGVIDVQKLCVELCDLKRADHTAAHNALFAPLTLYVLLENQDLPADVMKTDLEDARKKLILFKRVGRAYTNLPTPMDPDGTLHAASTVPHIKKHLKDNGWKDGNGYYRKLGLPSEEL